MSIIISIQLKPDYWLWIYGLYFVLLILGIYLLGKGLSRFREDNKPELAVIRFIPLPSNTHGNAFIQCVFGVLIIVGTLILSINEFITMHQDHLWACIGLISTLLIGGGFFGWWRFIYTRIDFKNSKILKITFLLIFISALFLRTYLNNKKRDELSDVKIGISESNCGQDSIAIISFTKAIKLDSTNIRAYYNRGIVESNLGKDSLAILDFNKTIELCPDTAEYYVSRGNSEANLDDDSIALVDFNKALTLDPYYSEGYNERGLFNASIDNDSLAIIDFDKAIELDPNNFNAYYNRGISEDASGDEDSLAIKDYTKAIKLNPKFGDALNNRGISERNIGKDSLAIIDFNKAIDLNNKDGIRYYNRGSTEFDMGDKNRALSDMKIAQELGNKLAETYIKQHFK